MKEVYIKIRDGEKTAEMRMTDPDRHQQLAVVDGLFRLFDIEINYAEMTKTYLQIGNAYQSFFEDVSPLENKAPEEWLTSSDEGISDPANEAQVNPILSETEPDLKQPEITESQHQEDKTTKDKSFTIIAGEKIRSIQGGMEEVKLPPHALPKEEVTIRVVAAEKDCLGKTPVQPVEGESLPEINLAELAGGRFQSLEDLAQAFKMGNSSADSEQGEGDIQDVPSPTSTLDDQELTEEGLDQEHTALYSSEDYYVTGIKVRKGKKHYRCRYKCECGIEGNHYIPHGTKTVRCHECGSLLKVITATKSGPPERDGYGNFYLAGRMVRTSLPMLTM